MKRSRNPRLCLHRETLRRLDPGSLRDAQGALSPDRGTANGCTVPSKVAGCSEAKCNSDDPTMNEACTDA